MGLFNFVKAAGEKIAGAVGIGEANAAEKLKEKVEGHDLGVKNLEISIEGDKVVLNGSAPSQEAVEKAILAAGNINGVAQVEANIQAPEAGQDPEFYEVKSGDTLSKIAREVYGDAKRYPEIFEANKPMLSHPDKIYPGQNLRIPRAEKAAA